VLAEARQRPLALGIHRHQPGTGSIPVLIAFGDVIGITFNPDGNVTATLVSAEESFSNPFPTKLVQRQCQWQTYSPDCGVPEADFSFDTVVTTRDRTTLTVGSVDGQPDNYYTLGKLKYGGEEYFIASQVGTAIKIVGGLPRSFDDALDLGDVPVTIVAGDDKTQRTCVEKFENMKRFMGFPYLPAIDPMKTGMALTDSVDVRHEPIV